MKRIAAIACVVVALSACGDDFERFETSDAASSSGGDTNGGSGADSTAADAKSEPTACKTDADCAAVAATTCQARRCLTTSTGSWCAAIALADGTSCDDGDACTLESTCSAGVCKATGQSVCGCKTAADCAAHDNGNACDGTLVCDTSVTPSRCKADLKTVVTCKPGDDSCRPLTCDPKDGACKPADAKDGTPCNDKEACTTDDACKAGVCTGATTICPCIEDKDCAAAEDGGLCNGTLYCNKTNFPPVCSVKPGTVVTCSSINDTDCTKNTCDKKTGTCAAKPAADKTACSDGDSCTASDICVQGECISGANTCPCTKAADCAKYEDGDACNGTLYCDVSVSKPTCVINPATVAACPTVDDPCLAAGCDKKTGACSVKSKPDQTKCDDGDPCTGGDHCEKGVCKPSAEICPCKADKDCATGQENKCLGPRFCDKSKAPFQCRHNPAKQVVCPITDNTECKTNTCDPKTGKCAFAPATEGKACNADGNPCTKGDVCKSGACVAGTNVCPCESDGECGKFEDGNVCNGTLYCDTSKLPLRCQVNPKTLVVCKSVDDTACQRNKCDPKTGICSMGPVNENGPCNADDSTCTKGDFCSAGVCTPGKNQCGCTKDADCAKYNGTDKCSGTYYCNKTQTPSTCTVNPKSVKTCGKSVGPCLVEKCDPATGNCAEKPQSDGSQCSDDEPCTVSDTCKAGKCTGKQICGCLTDKDCAGTNNGNLCAGTPHCDTDTFPSTCQPDPSTAITCPNLDAPCAEMVCQPSSGLCKLQAKPNTDSKPCDDDNPCTLNTTCSKLQCGGGEAKKCNDGNICTSDACDPNKADQLSDGCCFFKLSNATCSDGNKCTKGDLCSDGSCKGGPLDPCDDKNPCTADSCLPKLGCQHAKSVTSTCDDGNACTVSDHCEDGKCEGDAKDCDDGYQCTEDSCLKDGTCEHKPPPPPGFGDDSCPKGKGGTKGTCMPQGSGSGPPTEFLCCDATGCIK